MNMKEKIEAIINSGWKASFVITGGGLSFLGELTKRGGASKFLLYADVPYSPNTYIGGLGGKAVSKEMASNLSSRLESITGCCPDEQDKKLVCAFTAALYSDNQRDGRLNQGYINIHTRHVYRTLDSKLILDPNLGREKQEEECCRFIVDRLYEFIFEGEKG